MSISLVLLPAAFAAIGAWQITRSESDQSGRTACRVQTRMRDVRLLVKALVDTGAQVTESGKLLTALWQGIEAKFECNSEGTWQVDLTGDVDEVKAVEIIRAVDEAYGRCVQVAVLERLRGRAALAGMRVESEQVEDDLSVTVILEVGR